MTEIKRPGRIITFYSYKGGTGRSMALANIAWILAYNQKRVLVLDWDLEAPGLNRYFRPFLIDKDLTATEGIIDFVTDFAAEAITPLEEGERLASDWYTSKVNILEYPVSLRWKFPRGGTVDFIPAGQQGDTYSARFSSFNWQNFYDRLGGGAVFEEAKKQMRESYDYILVDSRTGVSDTAGICTVQLPDALVVCFTYNNQSIEGAAAVSRTVYKQRQSKPAGGEYPFKIFPVPMRVDQSEIDKLELRQKYAWMMFDPFLSHIEGSDHKAYWNRVEVPYIAYFAYEEILSCFKENASDPKKVLASMVRITSYLTEGEITDLSMPVPPEEKQRVLAEFAEVPGITLGTTSASMVIESGSDEKVRLAEAAYKNLSGDEQLEFRRLWLRLVRVARPGEAGRDSRLRVTTNELSAPENILGALLKSGLVSATNDRETGKLAVEASDEALIRDWARLRDWVAEDREFLLWRQKLNGDIQEWEKRSRAKDQLLRAGPLATAKDWLKKRPGDLSESEAGYIHESENARYAGIQNHLTKVARALGVIVVLAILAYLVTQHFSEKAALKNESAALAANSSGLGFLSGGDLVEAISYFNEAIKLKPDYAEAYANRGDVYLKQGDYYRAVQEFNRAIELKADDPAYYYKRGWAAFRSQDLSNQTQDSTNSAISDFNKSIELNPQNPELYNYRGSIYLARREYDKAIADYSEAIKIAPDQADGYINRGNVYAVMGDTAQARTDFQQVLSLPKKSQDAIQTATQNLKQLSQRGQADPGPTIITAAPPRVYLQFNDRDDTRILISLTNALNSKGYTVNKAELRPEPTTGDVRYYYLEDKENAETISNEAEKILAGMGVRLRLQIIKMAERYSNVSRGHIELWIPQLSRQSPQQRADKPVPRVTTIP